mmetsp:Transcript_34828/g.59706  ORF Transcript_34828/g.59706 Transcript_34828/m.59706 type:complete len:251 (-) Transcript_34828:12-764(-)
MSQTILIPNMYQTPAQQYQLQTGQPAPVIDRAQSEEHLLDFYEDVTSELSKFGQVDEVHVCNNLGDHLMGNVYAKFADEDGASAAQQALHGRFYAKRPLICEFSPVTDFREARCRQFDHGECTRGGYCNFMHLYKIPYDVDRRLFGHRPPASSSSSTRRRSRSPPPPRRRYDNYSYDRRSYSRRSRSPPGRYYRSPRYDRTSPRYERTSPRYERTSPRYDRRDGSPPSSHDDRYRAPSPPSPTYDTADRA